MTTHSETRAVAWPSLQPIPSTMRAVPLREFGGPEVLRPERLPVPEPGPGEVLIQVRAVSVGRLLDLAARSGNHPYAKFSFPHILGAEHVGLVAALGEGVEDRQVGDRVAVFPVIVTGDDEQTQTGFPELSPSLQIIGTHRPGAYAQYSAVPAQNTFKVPEDVSPTEAVSVALAGAVAMNQFERANVSPGSRVVVQGASSALGSTTALLAKHLGHDVVVSSRSQDKRNHLRNLGFTHVLDALHDEFPNEVRRAFDGRGANLVVDNLGEPTIWRHSLEILAPGGSLVSSGAFLGRNVDLSLQRLYSLGQRIIGVRTGNLDSARRSWDEVRAGFRSAVDRLYPLQDAAHAHRYVEGSENFGRVALLVD